MQVDEFKVNLAEFVLKSTMESVLLDLKTEFFDFRPKVARRRSSDSGHSLQVNRNYLIMWHNMQDAIIVH